MLLEEYEEYVAGIFQKRGYETVVTPLSGDWGIDVIAIKGEEKIAIQAKMFGHTSRKVNRTVVMQLYGAMAYQDCTKAVIATDGELLDDAVLVANKLGIEILYTGRNGSPQMFSVCRTDNSRCCNKSAIREGYPSFGEMWQNYIMPLKGKTLYNSKGRNKLIDINMSGVTRITSSGKKGNIKIEAFRLAYNEMLSKGFVTRDYINQQVDGRCSSGVVLILSQLHFVELEQNPLMLKLKV